MNVISSEGCWNTTMSSVAYRLALQWQALLVEMEYHVLLLAPPGGSWHCLALDVVLVATLQHEPCQPTRGDLQQYIQRYSA
jgi:hypothetical protein